jgi:hypothetical protein
MGGDLTFERPPNLFDRIELMPAVGGLVGQLDSRMSGDPLAGELTGVNAGIVHQDVDAAQRMASSLQSVASRRAAPPTDGDHTHLRSG